MQIHTYIKDYLLIIIGSFLVSFGVVGFFIANNITTGGSPGVALLLYHISGFSVGSMIIAYNIPLLILGWKYLGKVFAFKTIVTIALMSLFADILNEVIVLNVVTNDLLLATIFGGVIIGIGVGLILQANASAGGSTLIARIFASHFEIKPAQVIIIVDVSIVLASIYVFNDIEKALWSILSIYITGKSIDAMLSGGVKQKVVHITSDKVGVLAAQITEKLGKEGTIVSGDDLFHNREKKMIFILVKLGKLRLLREIIKEYDDKAVMVVIDASELLGR